MTRPGPAFSSPAARIYLATTAVDGRKSFDTLCEQVRTALGCDPLSGDLFVFHNRHGDRVKILFWDANGLVLYTKRLEQGRFRFPGADQVSITLTAAELMTLLAAGGAERGA